MKFKRILCSAIAAATALVSTLTVMPVIPTEASYITFLEGDIDNNNVVNLNDAAIIGKYLCGKIGLDNKAMRRADANHDKLIDQSDRQKIIDYNLGLDTPLTKNKSTYTDIDDSNMNVLIHKYQPGIALTDFDEQPLYAPGNAYTYKSNNKRIMSNSSALTLDTQNITTVKIEKHNSNGSKQFMGSGFIVDKHLVATAGHVLCTRTSSGKLSAYDNLYVAVYDEFSTKSKSSFLGEGKVKSFQVPKLFEEGNADGSYMLYDVGLIYVEEDLSKIVKQSSANPSSEKIASIGFSTKEFIDKKVTVHVSGYTNDGRRYYSAEGGKTFNLYDNRLSSEQLTHLNEHVFMSESLSNYGQSGGPVYYEKSINGKKIKTVIGIISGPNFYYKKIYGINRENEIGSRYCKITPTIARFLLNNPYVDSTEDKK